MKMKIFPDLFQERLSFKVIYNFYENLFFATRQNLEEVSLCFISPH